MKRNFSPEQNSIIFAACEAIRKYMLAKAADTSDLKKDDFVALLITDDIEDNSTIHLLIQSQAWNILFRGDKWLTILQGANHVSSLRNTNENGGEDDRIKDYLGDLLSYFPEETQDYIKMTTS